MEKKKLQIVDVTLREGEQFAKAYFTTEMKIELAHLMDEFGIEYIEVTSPACSPQSWEDARILSNLGLNAKITAHVRCTKDDIDISLDAGVDVIHMMYATSPILQKYSHGKNIDYIREQAVKMTEYLKGKNIEARFSGEDATRSNIEDLEKVFDGVVEAGINRIGLPDTTGIALPEQIQEYYSYFKKKYNIDMEFHGHNDTGCAVINAYTALESGATHINTSILGIGERNGITSLGGLIARLYHTKRDYIEDYDLRKIIDLDKKLAEFLDIDIPFNNYFSSENAFYHGAGIHTNAIIKNPGSYEIFNIDDFGATRHLEVGHRLMGKNVIELLGKEMGLSHTREEYIVITKELKALTDKRRYSKEEVKDYIKTWNGKK
ncbi:homocitrate synthase [bacterium]|nr:homocitrate synthase [bacterium]